MKYKNIVISGLIGSGTTTLATNLAKNLNWKHQSTGDFFRQYHLENNIPLWNTKAVPAELDQKIDNYIFEQLRDQENLVIDSHYGGWFARNLDFVLKVLLTCSEKEIVQRVLNRKHTHQESAEEIKKRQEQLDQKFRALYANEDYLDPKSFNLEINTTGSTPKKTLEKVLTFLNS